MPSLLAALGASSKNVLGIEATDRACLLLVDGLGWELLRAHADLAPFLSSLVPMGRAITAGFPASTAPSLASLSTGAPPGEHGLVGYAMAVPGLDHPMNTILWSLYRPGPFVDLTTRVAPEELQRLSPLLGSAGAAGIQATVVAPPHFEGSGLTAAIWRGARFTGLAALDGPGADEAVRDALCRGGRSIVYAYHGDLDGAGHASGVDSPEWRAELRRVDEIAERLAGRVPAGAALFVTGDHGMIDMPPGASERLDLADEPALASGVRYLGGDPRARHVYTDGGSDGVLARWRERLGHGMWVLSRDEAIDAGWFGPTVLDHVRPRIGDVVAASFGPIGGFDREIDPQGVANIGQHGSMEPAEQLVPLLTFRRR